MPTTITKTVKSSGGDYTSLSAWEAGEQGDLIAADQIKKAECYAFQDTTAFTIDGSTTSDTQYMYVTVPTAERHDGKYNTSKYRLEATNGVLGVQDLGTVIEGIQIKCLMTNGNSKSAVDIRQTFGTVTIKECIVKLDLTGATDAFNLWGINVVGLANQYRAIIVNTLVYDCVSVGGYPSGNAAGIFVSDDLADKQIYNCTAQGCSTGYKVDDNGAFNVTLKNCIAQDCSDGYLGTWGGSSTNNCSDISSDAPGSASQTGSVTFVDEAGDDFHLSTSDTVAKANGTNLSTDTDYPFSIDIHGHTRGAVWDIGADQLQASTKAIIKSHSAVASIYA